MQNNFVFKNADIHYEEFDKQTNTLTINNIQNEIFYLTFDHYFPQNMHINVVNSNMTIIETYLGNIANSKLIINIDENSSLKRFSLLVENESDLTIVKDINNYGVYHSLQIDLTNHSINSTENISLLKEEAEASVVNGIYAFAHANKKYQTNLNHSCKLTKSKAQIFAINDDFAHVQIYTDAYIKNGAIGSKTNQEGRIINLSNTCNGIVLPNLHIDENDVEASHSCSVGSLNQEHLYYLESRGLDTLHARNILIKGYFNPIIENIEDEKIKATLETVITQRIG